MYSASALFGVGDWPRWTTIQLTTNLGVVCKNARRKRTLSSTSTTHSFYIFLSLFFVGGSKRMVQHLFYAAGLEVFRNWIAEKLELPSMDGAHQGSHVFCLLGGFWPNSSCLDTLDFFLISPILDAYQFIPVSCGKKKLGLITEREFSANLCNWREFWCFHFALEVKHAVAVWNLLRFFISSERDDRTMDLCEKVCVFCDMSYHKQCSIFCSREHFVVLRLLWEF